MNIPLIIAALVLPYCIGGFIDNNSDKYSNSKLVHTWETTAAWLKGLLRNHSFGAEDVTNGYNLRCDGVKITQFRYASQRLCCY